MQEDIITILNNAVSRGEPLQQAVQVLINSGYDPQAVQEASKYVGGGSMQNLQSKPDEQLIMAQNKSLLGSQPAPNMNPQPANPVNPQTPPQLNSQNQMNQQNQMQPPTQTPSMSQQPQTQLPPQNQVKPLKPLNQSDPYAAQPMDPKDMHQLAQPAQNQDQTQQTNNQQQQVQQAPPVKIKKKSHKKEIFLLIILLVLIGVLASTIMFRDTILGFLSG